MGEYASTQTLDSLVYSCINYYEILFSAKAEIGMEPNPVYGMGTGGDEGQSIPTQPNPVYGMGTGGDEGQSIPTQPNPVYGMGTSVTTSDTTTVANPTSS